MAVLRDQQLVGIVGDEIVTSADRADYGWKSVVVEGEPLAEAMLANFGIYDREPDTVAL